MESKYDPTIGFKKSAKSIGGLALFAALGAIALAFLEPGVLEVIFQKAGVNTAYSALAVLALRGAATQYLNWRKHAKPTDASDLKAGALGGMLLLAMMPSFAFAQVERRISLSIETGVASTWVEGVKDERAGVILNADVPFKRAGWATRIDIAGSRGQTAVDLTNPSTFRSTEILSALYLEAKGGVDAICFGGVSYSIEGDEGRPADVRMYTGACGVRGRAAGQSLIFAYGRRGAIGGQGFLASLTVKKGEKGRLHLDGALASTRRHDGSRPWELRSTVTYVPWSTKGN